MEYRVFYSDGRPGTHLSTIDAVSPRMAAKQFFSEHPAYTARRITVEAEDHTIEQFNATDFMDAASRAGLQPTPTSATIRRDETRVIITDINMRFSSMIVFMVKWAFAAIPAIIIIFLVVIAVALGVGLLSHK